MTTRSTVDHRCRGAENPQSSSSELESPTQTLLRLVTNGDPTGGIAKEHFCSLFGRCPYCFAFMTWDVARHHSCRFDDALANWGASDESETDNGFNCEEESL